MADHGTNAQVHGIEALKKHFFSHKLDVSLWASRASSILFTLAYFLPFFGNPYSAYYRVLLSNAVTSSIRLHQRMPPFSFSKEFIMLLFSEDSFHYLLYTMIFIYMTPVTLVLLPVFLFSLIHFASYSLTLLDLLGQNSWWGARLLISLVEFQTRNILRLIAFTEIFLMLLVLTMLFMGRTGLLTPLMYYHFLTMRYSSNRNPHTRIMFAELRRITEYYVNKPFVPSIVRSIVSAVIITLCRASPDITPMAERR